MWVVVVVVLLAHFDELVVTRAWCFGDVVVGV
jgi:hypothetical protein